MNQKGVQEVNIGWDMWKGRGEVEGGRVDSCSCVGAFRYSTYFGVDVHSCTNPLKTHSSYKIASQSVTVLA